MPKTIFLMMTAQNRTVVLNARRRAKSMIPTETGTTHISQQISPYRSLVCEMDPKRQTCDFDNPVKRDVVVRIV